MGLFDFSKGATELKDMIGDLKQVIDFVREHGDSIVHYRCQPVPPVGERLDGTGADLYRVGGHLNETGARLAAILPG